MKNTKLTGSQLAAYIAVRFAPTLAPVAPAPVAPAAGIIATLAAGIVKESLLAFAVEKSANAKTGPVSTTYVTQASCDPSCAFFSSGCYAESGPVGIHTARLNKAGGGKLADIDPELIAHQEATAIDTLTGTRDMRLHVVGDAKTPGAARILADAAGRFIAKFGKRVWSYTHAWRAVSRDSWGNQISILASCETLADARLAMAAGYATALVVAEHPTGGKAWRDGDVTVIPCPAQTKPNVTCLDCKLCWRDQWLLSDRKVIAFEAHGSGTKKAKSKLVPASPFVVIN